MTPGLTLLIAGVVLIVAGYKNRNVIDVILGLEREREGGSPKATAAVQGLMDNVPLLEEEFSTVTRGLATFDGKLVAAWIAPVLRWARANGWKGQVTSGYRTKEQQAAACANTTGPCAEPGRSNHQKVRYPGGAVDVTDYETLARLVPQYPGPGPTLKHATFANDPVHFSGNGR